MMSDRRTVRAIVPPQPIFDAQMPSQPKILALHESESRREIQRRAVREWKALPLSQRLAMVDRFVDLRLSEAGFDGLADFERDWVRYEAHGRVTF